MSNGFGITVLFFVIVGVIALVYFLNQTGGNAKNIPSLSSLEPSQSPQQNPLSFSGNGTGIGSKVQGAQAQNTQKLPQTEEQGPVASVSAATIHTTKGDITINLYTGDAPKTVANFEKKAKSGFYNGLTFHRVEDWVIQGGDPLGNGTGGGTMLTEINALPFVRGSVGVARGSDINVSNDSQFFIIKNDASWLNKQYTNFGMVTSGMDVVDKIEIGDKIQSISLQE